MRRVVSVIIAIISGIALIWFGILALGAYAATAIDQYGGAVSSRPAVLSPQVVQQALTIYVLIVVVALVAMIISIISAVRATPN